MTAQADDLHIVHQALVQYFGRLEPSIDNYELLVLHARVHKTSDAEVRTVLQGEKWRMWYKTLPGKLLHAATHDHLTRVKDLLRIDVRPGNLTVRGELLFNFLCGWQKVDMARLFVTEGHALDNMSHNQKLELVIANVRLNRIRTVNFLVGECNISVRDATPSGETALIVAVMCKHVDMIDLLLPYSEHIDTLYGGQTMLHVCIRTPVSRCMIKVLLDRGANPQIVNLQGESPLELAVRYNSLDMVTDLLDGGANINNVNATGNTALHVAVNHGFTAMSQLLRMRGADVDIVNALGETARAIAEKWRHVKILEFL